MELEKLWLGICPINNIYKIRLLETFKSSQAILENILSNNNDMVINKETKEKLLNTWNKDKLKIFRERIEKSNIQVVTLEDENYNTNLSNIGENKPYILFYKGDIKELNKFTVAVVGSRHCTDYGKNVCISIVEELVSLGINVISGGAEGIDAIAHRTALKNNGFTAAVLGSGIDVLYPYSNKNLFKEISEKGVLISEFPPDTKPHNYNFPNRNRIISGISDIIIVVEAKETSGSIITGHHGVDQGKDILAVPGTISMKNSRGCNKLIQEGANIYLGLQSIYSLLTLNLKWYNQQKNSPAPIKNLTLKESILNLISDRPIHIDELQKYTNVDITLLYELLFEMQLNKEIISLSGNFYARVI
ncbi:DNA processing protein [Clostridium amylolyticum]|uniref:DNA processing protein n=1 Tax=Clostridium amylolyticum TaxID=1121298 RepID=A0A1M6D9G1_9CLOT|nr:DNA-processing protein DprA [Clostridium amylolyticum]SHI69862.1 DNA processing protein [Clostridium amylolyticum]